VILVDKEKSEMTSKIESIVQAVDRAAGRARSMYYVKGLNEYMCGRGKEASASLASNPGVQFCQSRWFSSGKRMMIGGGGTTGKSALYGALVGTEACPSDWTPEDRLTILLDIILFRAFPSAISFVGHLAISSLGEALLKKEASKRWGSKVADAFVIWHKATVLFLESISEFDEKAPAAKKAASKMPSLSELTGYNKERERDKATAIKAGKARSVPPSPDVLEAAEALRMK